MDSNSFSANILNGVARLVMTYGDLMKDDIFKEKVGNSSVKEIVRMAKDRHAGALGYAEAMLICYNKKMKVPLKWGSLYSVKGRKVNFSIEEHDNEIMDEPADTE